MTTDELNFENRLEALGRDGRACALFIYTELALEHLAAHDGGVRERVEADADFWWAVLTGLQTAGVAALDRIYDEDRNAGSAAQVLRFAERHRSIFSRASLDARKRGAGLPGQADGARTPVHELAQGDLAEFFFELDEKRCGYAAIVQPVREQLLEDLAKPAHLRRDALFAGDRVKHLEPLAVFPLRVHSALCRLYYDGRAPAADAMPTAIADVLAAAPTQEWEHCRAARSVMQFTGARGFPAQPRPVAAAPTHERAQPLAAEPGAG